MQRKVEIMNGWIKLHRKILDWGWYSDINTRVVFIHLLLLANFDDRYYLGKLIKRGDCVVALSTLAQQTSLTLTQVRTALNHLKSTHEITIKTTNKYSIVTICNFDNYQVLEIENNTQDNKQDNKQVTNKQQTNNTQDNNTIRINNLTIKENKEERESTHPTLEEVESHCVYLGLSNYTDGTTKSPARLTAEKFYDHFNSVGWVDINNRKIVDWRSRLANWIRDDYQRQLQQKKKSGQEYSDEQQDALIEILTHKTK